MDNYKLPDRKKINDINQIYDGKKLLFKEFINLDLSNLDLSIIPKEEWENCIFFNTSFKNTNIKFIPNKLANLSQLSNSSYFKSFSIYNIGLAMPYCNFSDNDLTYLTREDFLINSYGEEAVTNGCDFTNTGINFLKTLVNIKLDSSYQNYDFDDEYWKYESGTLNWPDFIDINTIIKNPFLKVPSFRILNAITRYVMDTNYNSNYFRFLNKDYDEFGFIIDCKMREYIENIVNNCEKYLEYDKQGYAKKLYYKLYPFLNLKRKFDFFMFSIKDLNIKDVDFEDIPVEVLRYYEVFNNHFENVKINSSLSELLNLWSGHFIDFIPGYKNEYKEFYTPNIKFDSWKENYGARKRVSDSAITFFSKVYLELSRTCNAKCPFCRNESFSSSNYDKEKIKETLNEIKNYINAVVIGGGEPTLRLNDVKELHQSIDGDTIDWHMFTNGTNPFIIHDDYIMDNFKLNLSRHCVNDAENADIFKANNIMTSSDIEKLNLRNKEVTLNAVCFKGGLDSFEKIIDYIKYANDIGCKKVLIQDLQRELSLGNNIKDNNLCIDSDILPKVKEYLKINGYKEKYPVYATGGYVSYILKNKDGFQVTIQIYITKKELDMNWPKSIKRAFDLSIDPSGNLYGNWNQKEGAVKILKK